MVYGDIKKVGLCVRLAMLGFGVVTDTSLLRAAAGSGRAIERVVPTDARQVRALGHYGAPLGLFKDAPVGVSLPTCADSAYSLCPSTLIGRHVSESAPCLRTENFA